MGMTVSAVTKSAGLGLLSLMLAAAAHAASSQPDTSSGQQFRGHADAQAPVQVAQARVFDVYIDGQGREVIVDPRTGQVVEVRPPQIIDRREYIPPAVTVPETNRRVYVPWDAERARRDREVELGRREQTPDIYEPNDGFNQSYDDQPSDWGEPLGADDFVNPQVAPPIDRGSIERAPLAPPIGSEGSEMASAPEDDGSDALAPKTLEPFKPDMHGIEAPGIRGASDNVAKFQVLLDRAGASPGVIDGRMGGNVNKAIDAYQKITGQRLKTYDKQFIEEQIKESGGPVFTEYEITPQDVAGPYVASVPEDYGEKARLDRLGYTSVSEMLAERFHMDENYLKQLNRDADFDRAGTIIKVVSPGGPVTAEVASIVADKSEEQVRAYDESGALVAAYPATIGSTDTPSPTGTHKVERIAFNPEYTYNPKINFKQGSNDKVLTIPPGPNGPVGVVWIALDKPTYGIHGTPEPSKIGKTSSHGCVRLTNWDAQELAKIVKPGVTVEFVD